MGNAHALHAAPPMPSASVEVPTQAPTQAAPAPANQFKDDGLNLAESKIDEDKLQVGYLTYLFRYRSSCTVPRPTVLNY